MIEENILMSILAEVRKLNKDSRLWGIDDVADYFGMSRTTVTKKIINDANFPKPISINNTLPRWEPEEVKDWAKKQRS